MNKIDTNDMNKPNTDMNETKINRIEEYEFSVKVLFVDKQKSKSKPKVWSDIEEVVKSLNKTINTKFVSDNNNFDFLIIKSKVNDYGLEECREKYGNEVDKKNGHYGTNGNEIGNRSRVGRTFDNFIEDLQNYVI